MKETIKYMLKDPFYCFLLVVGITMVPTCIILIILMTLDMLNLI